MKRVYKFKMTYETALKQFKQATELYFQHDGITLEDYKRITGEFIATPCIASRLEILAQRLLNKLEVKK